MARPVLGAAGVPRVMVRATQPVPAEPDVDVPEANLTDVGCAIHVDVGEVDAVEVRVELRSG